MKKVVILNKEGLRVGKEHIVPDDKAEGKRRSLQAFCDHRYPDLGWHALILPHPDKLYNVYNKSGTCVYRNVELAEAKQLVDSNDDWTYWEVSS